MEIVRSGNNYGVTVAAVNKLFRRVVCVYIGKQFLRDLETLGIYIRNGGNSHFLMLAVNVHIDMGCSHIAYTYNSVAHGLNFL